MSKQTNENIRNIAIIAHVDHGKTTLVDQLFKQSGLFEKERISNDEDRLMDNMDLERERGITIAAKNCSVHYNGIKINIIDTPGHADFGGEVERSLKMVDGAILLVDASEGPLPQTRFVLQKSLDLGLKIIVVVNKIDRADARAQEVLDEIYDLFIDLGASDEQIDFPVYYAIGRDGIARESLDGTETDMKVLFDAITTKIPGPSYDDAEPFQMLVCNIGYSDYTGRLAIGRVFNGKVKRNDQLVCIDESGSPKNLKVSKLQVYEGMAFQDVDEVGPGDAIVLSGISDVQIGDTICHVDDPKALPRVTVDEPTVAMRFSGNTSPFSGKEGEWNQTQRIHERLKKEALFNVAIKVDENLSGDSFTVRGRGEFQLAVIIETMRREGYELCVGRPQIITKMEDGVKKEPIEHLIIDCGDEYTGAVTEKLSLRKGRMVNMSPFGVGRVRLEFSIPTRGLIGYRNEFLTDTKGTGIMSSYLTGFEEHRGDIKSRQTGSLIADRPGKALAYALFNLEDRGKLIITPNTEVYEGMIIGEHSRDNDLCVNVIKGKKLTNMRASGKDEAVTLVPVTPMTLEQALEFIKDDELVEVTPQSIRIRKTVLTEHDRKLAEKAAKASLK
jgi:GTP-binding protein